MAVMNNEITARSNETVDCQELLWEAWKPHLGPSLASQVAMMLAPKFLSAIALRGLHNEDQNIWEVAFALELGAVAYLSRTPPVTALSERTLCALSQSAAATLRGAVESGKELR